MLVTVSITCATAAFSRDMHDAKHVPIYCTQQCSLDYLSLRSAGGSVCVLPIWPVLACDGFQYDVQDRAVLFPLILVLYRLCLSYFHGIMCRVNYKISVLATSNNTNFGTCLNVWIRLGSLFITYSTSSWYDGYVEGASHVGLRRGCGTVRSNPSEALWYSSLQSFGLFLHCKRCHAQVVGFFQWCCDLEVLFVMLVERNAQCVVVEC